MSKKIHKIERIPLKNPAVTYTFQKLRCPVYRRFGIAFGHALMPGMREKFKPFDRGPSEFTIKPKT